MYFIYYIHLHSTMLIVTIYIALLPKGACWGLAYALRPLPLPPHAGKQPILPTRLQTVIMKMVGNFTNNIQWHSTMQSDKTENSSGSYYVSYSMPTIDPMILEA